MHDKIALLLIAAESISLMNLRSNPDVLVFSTDGFGYRKIIFFFSPLERLLSMLNYSMQRLPGRTEGIYINEILMEVFTTLR